MIRLLSTPARMALVIGALTVSVASAEEIQVDKCIAEFPERFTCSTDRTGVISFVPKEGSRVRAGEVVVQLRDELPRAELAVAEERVNNDAAIQAAITEAESIEVELSAVRDANSRAATSVSVFPPTHLKRLELQLAAAQHRVEQARQEQRIAEKARDQAQALVEMYSIPSKIGGIVTDVSKHLGEGVQQAEPILEIVNTDTIRVKGYVSVAESFRVKVGMPVKVQFELPESAEPIGDRIYEGTLGYIDVLANPVSNEVIVWAEVPNEDGFIREGLWANMSIDTGSSSSPSPADLNRPKTEAQVPADPRRPLPDLNQQPAPSAEETPRSFRPTDTLPRF